MRFLLNQTLIDEPDLPVDLTVLEYLRQYRRLTGTKEGCASGDCGACTVVVASVAGSALRYQSMNSCIALMGNLHGKQLICVEHLADGDRLHSVQQAMVDCHGSQCGYCTPGFVMSMFALTKQASPPAESRKHQIERFLGGNLCRCTGYRPIIDASARALDNRQEDQFDRAEADTIKRLAAVAEPDAKAHFYQPTTLQELLRYKHDNPPIPVVSGCTDFALEITQRLTSFAKLISSSRLTELNYIRTDGDQWRIGAGCSIETLLSTLGPLNHSVRELLQRYGSTQVRNQATVGGNIGNASPIGDLPPLFIVMGAVVVMQSIHGKRELPLEHFFLDYKKTALRADEIITEVYFPEGRLTSVGTCRVYKVSKRIDDDISTVCAAFHWMPDEKHGGVLTAAFGGMAAIPKRATALEAAATALQEPGFDADTAARALQGDFSPIADARGSAGYRLELAQNLFKKFYLELHRSTGKDLVKLSDISHA